MSRSKEAPMSVNELRDLLDLLDDTRELVLRREAGWAPVRDAWWDAREDAADAYREWSRLRTEAAYAAYRAAQDREDAAQDALAASAGR
jgi:hypothetical protein